MIVVTLHMTMKENMQDVDPNHNTAAICDQPDCYIGAQPPVHTQQEGGQDVGVGPQPHYPTLAEALGDMEEDDGRVTFGADRVLQASSHYLVQTLWAETEARTEPAKECQEFFQDRRYGNRPNRKTAGTLPARFRT